MQILTRSVLLLSIVNKGKYEKQFYPQPYSSHLLTEEF